jgi:uncharacterized membrane protein YgcG
MSMLKGQTPDFETALQDCLDAIADGRRTVDECLAKYPAYADEIAPLLYMASSLRDARAVRPSLGFRKQARSRMQQRIAASSRKPSALVDTRKSRQKQANRGLFGFPTLAFRALIALIVVGMLTSVTGVTAFAADGAAPGDALYLVDTAVEQFSLTLTRSADGRLNLQLAIANERMAEAETLINAGEDAYANEALTLYDETVINIEATADQVDPDQRDEAQEKVKSNLDRHIAKMTELLDRVPPQARDNIERHIQKTIEKANKHNQGGSDDSPGNSGGNGNGNGNAGGNGNGNGGSNPSDDDENTDSGSTSSGSDGDDDLSTPDEHGNGNGHGHGKGDDHPGNGNGNGNANGSSNDDNENENDNSGS